MSDGGTIDIKDGYHQFLQTAKSAKRVVAKLRVPKPGEAGQWIILIVIHLVGIFGHAIAGNIFCSANMMVDRIFNKRRRTPRSKTYIDDTMIIGPRRYIRSWVEEWLCRDCQGSLTVQADKVNCWEDRLEGIGWELNLEAWAVLPKEKGLAKQMVKAHR